jgi:hypothetical protein
VSPFSCQDAESFFLIIRAFLEGPDEVSLPDIKMGQRHEFEILKWNCVAFGVFGKAAKLFMDLILSKKRVVRVHSFSQKLSRLDAQDCGCEKQGVRSELSILGGDLPTLFTNQAFILRAVAWLLGKSGAQVCSGSKITAFWLSSISGIAASSASTGRF